MSRRNFAAFLTVILLVFGVAAVAQTGQTDRQALQQICGILVNQGVATGCVTTTAPTSTTSTTTTRLPPTSSTTTTTTIPPTTTTSTTLPPTTTSTIPAGQSYVNPINTGAKGTLGVYSGPLQISTTQTIQNVVVRGEIRVCGNATVTFRNVRWEPTSTVTGGRAFQVDGGISGCTGSPTMILDHVTIDADGRTQRGVSAQRGGIAQVRFADISGVEDCMNTLGGTSTKPNILADSYCHDQIAPSGAHRDGYQIMGGWAHILRNVFDVPESATAAVFPKSEGSSVNVLVQFNYGKGAGYTIRFGDAINNSVTGTYTDNEVLEDSYNFGAYLPPQNGATATTARNIIVDWDIGEAGFHPGPQS